MTTNQVQQLSLRASTAGGTGSLSGQGTKVPQVAWHGQKNKMKFKINKPAVKKKKLGPSDKV